jgi:23S rRNA (guanine2445-N2)-methyltransferase / 23S rRNA (guanine2069-N7)-methyltransferase
VRPSGGGLRFGGGLEVAYRACLWSRLVSRVLLPLWRVEAGSSDAFYTGVRELPWERHLARGATFAVDARARGAAGIHTHFVELKAKDAIVDRLREVWGARPDVDVDDPDFRLHILVDGEEAQLSLDLSGEPLHRRGYRRESGAAPLKENIAAALLLRARWPEVVAAGGALVDPMCGSGTILAEAALLALDIAPGLLRCAPRERFGFRGWRGHDRELWSKLRAEAERRRDAGRSRLPRLAGGDADPEALRLTAASLAAAGIDGVRLERADVGAARPPEGVDGGLVATNAPYGHRVGDRDELPGVYRRLGEALKERFAGWSLALLTADAKLAGEVRMRPFRRNSLWNGSIRCELLQYRIGERPPELERSRAPAH